jgi:hypothetical protein
MVEPAPATTILGRKKGGEVSLEHRYVIITLKALATSGKLPKSFNLKAITFYFSITNHEVNKLFK